MPPKSKFTKEQITDAALSIVREKGPDAVTARSVGAALSSSPKVIFGSFSSMEELMDEVLRSANKLYERYLAEDMAKDEYPPYKASGMSYIRFAKEERELFKLLFMRDRSNERIDESYPEEVIAVLQENTGLSREQALLFHLEIWVWVHGIATMIATNYLNFSTEQISEMLSEVYWSMRDHLTKEDA